MELSTYHLYQALFYVLLNGVITGIFIYFVLLF